MNIPNTVKIGGFTWTVEQREDVTREGDAFGLTHFTKQKIFLDPNETQQKKEQVLLHEILHAIWWQQGLGARYKDKDDLEEEMVQAMSMGLYQVLKDNKFNYEK